MSQANLDYLLKVTGYTLDMSMQFGNSVEFFTHFFSVILYGTAEYETPLNIQSVSNFLFRRVVPKGGGLVKLKFLKM